MQTALDPANSIIERFGGQDTVMEITGASRTRVYRWTQPREKGGTDGLIPMPHASKLLQHAKKNGLPVTADDFMPIPTREEAA
ncbi:MAG: helix-turn-helix domain-containing protein [Mesorhizobium sp.]|uniref:hypothetical protein n=1 Tax=Mesorhizobium sp. TaxID=1871066 RepID=UPI000FE851E5|nr:hypothetical protein [Mesorhizobium sp.]RWF41613.1 MAG: helix-turn-helix domain-containing protein [Mesorhizobium sp.]